MLAKTGCGILLTFGLWFGTASAQNFVSFDYPEAVSTSANGINDDGAVVGVYVDKNGKQHGFLLSGGQFTTVDYPGALSTTPYGISNTGDIVGYHVDTTGLPGGGYRGFLSRGGTFSDVNHPGHMNTMPIRITDEGVVVGCYHDTDTMGTMHGFAFKNGTFNPLSMEASMNNAVSPDGTLIAGRYFDMMTGVSHSYLASNDVVAPFDFPFSVASSAWDMNANREVVGVYTDAAKKGHGFLLRLDDSVMTFGINPQIGLSGSFSFATIDYPGATTTSAVGINRAGDVVGSYVDIAGKTHAFFLGRGRHRRN